jgi:hypothetical protein
MSDVDSIHEATRRPPSGGRGRLIVLLVLLGVLVAGAVYWVLAQDGDSGDGPRPTATVTPPPVFETVAEFEGDGDETTDEFTVAKGWQIRWKSSGPFELAITGDQNLGTVVKQNKAEEGVVVPVGTGTFQLEVKADDDWSVTVVEPE